MPKKKYVVEYAETYCMATWIASEPRILINKSMFDALASATEKAAKTIPGMSNTRNIKKRMERMIVGHERAEREHALKHATKEQREFLYKMENEGFCGVNDDPRIKDLIDSAHYHAERLERKKEPELTGVVNEVAEKMGIE